MEHHMYCHLMKNTPKQKLGITRKQSDILIKKHTKIHKLIPSINQKIGQKGYQVYVNSCHGLKTYNVYSRQKKLINIIGKTKETHPTKLIK